MRPGFSLSENWDTTETGDPGEGQVGKRRRDVIQEDALKVYEKSRQKFPENMNLELKKGVYARKEDVAVTASRLPRAPGRGAGGAPHHGGQAHSSRRACSRSTFPGEGHTPGSPDICGDSEPGRGGQPTSGGGM